MMSKAILKERIKFYNRLFFYCIPTEIGRTNYLRKHQILALIGENVRFQPRIYPTDAKSLKIHNNVCVARGVNFIMHDIMCIMFNGLHDGNEYIQNRSCIEILDNCFIGSGAQICPNVRIGPNAIVAAGAVVTKDVPEGEVWGGVPARKIGDFETIRLKQLEISKKVSGMNKKERLDYEWNRFYSERE